MVLLGLAGCRPPATAQAAPAVAPAATIEVPALPAVTAEPAETQTEPSPASTAADGRIEQATSDRVPAAEPAPLPEEAGSVPAYDRDDWRHWIDADHDCQDTRQEVLIEESEVPVTFKDTRKCRVATGRWTCRYTGRVFTDPGQLDVDHMVPLENAHSSGGWAWDSDRKKEYANYLDEPEHLVAVYRGANRSKGSRGPEEWMPTNEDAWCNYVGDWIGIKGRWGLEMTDEERAGINELLAGCGH